jgi:peptidoglycan/LPS O-acetylase OafA/YrhL
MTEEYAIPASTTPRVAQEPIQAVRVRVDIQALRGWAVLVVVLYHTGLFPFLGSGYLGVDIFFVVSGYLITGLVLRSIDAGTFTFASFYARRAKRLLPAAYVMLVATTLVSLQVLISNESREFFAQLIGAATFTSNIVLWSQAGYFAPPAAMKPLLHMWSLSIEEQYYLLLPAALVLVPRRLWTSGAVLVCVSSLGICLALVPVKPGVAFYFLPARAWELALGSLGAIALDRYRESGWVRRAFWPSFLALLALPFLPSGMPHPGLAAVAICVSTLVVILGRARAMHESWPVITMAKLGNMSYSLYLVHWPLMALAANLWLTEIPSSVRVALLAGAFILAWLLYRYVEQPAREAPVTPRMNLALVAGGIALVLFGALGLQVDSQLRTPVREFRAGNHGLSAKCDYQDAFSAKAECQTSSAPRIMVWGDSQAMHLMQGITATAADVIQATKSSCGPLLSISMFRVEDSYNKAWGMECIRFNTAVLDFVSRSQTIETVVLASWFGQYMAGRRIVSVPAFPGEPFIEVPGSVDVAIASLRSTVAELRKNGKRVILVATPPAGGFDVGRCLEMRSQGKLRVGADFESCKISEQGYRAARSEVLTMLERIEAEAFVPVVHLDRYLCADGSCSVEIDAVPLYRDAGHLSIDGSKALGLKVNLGALVQREAK